MKLQNPFDRQKKKDFVPLSLFPASKMTRTTVPIGRAVPVYFNDMVQGNKIKLNVNQLTRFATMNAPVMNNYEVDFGAFFVPYVSFDSYFTSNWFRTNLRDSNIAKYTLHAREFFNPSTADSLRVHPATIEFSKYKEHSEVGSIYDHLGWPIFANTDLDDKFWVTCDMSGTVLKNTWTSDNLMTDVNASHKLNGSSDATLVSGVDPIFDDSYRCTFLQWCLQYVQANFVIDLNNGDPYPWHYVSFDEAQENWETFFDENADLVWNVIALLFNNPTNASSVPTWKSIFGTVTLDSLYNGYLNYLSVVKKSKYDGVTLNVVRWLAYHRIYADWFLNELYTNREDYLDMIGAGYQTLCVGQRFGLAFTSGPYSSAKNEKLSSSPDLEFFAKYIRKGECMPVLWNKDRFTAAVKVEAASNVAIGSTISEHYYNRMYAKFKDLVARMTSDYKKNSDALYGHEISDHTLNRSQLVGYRSFDVQIGDVAQNSQSTMESNLGQFGGYAVSRDSTKPWEWTADENGIFVVLAWIRPRFVAITNACDRSIFKKQYFDYLLPQFGGVGYQDVSYKEIYPDALSNQAFSLQERYSEYMSVLNESSGYMRTTLKHYNSDRTLVSTPGSLKGSNDGLRFLYMTEDDDLHRVFCDTTTDPVAIACYFDGTVTRQLPAYIQTEF